MGHATWRDLCNVLSTDNKNVQIFKFEQACYQKLSQKKQFFAKAVVDLTQYCTLKYATIFGNFSTIFLNFYQLSADLVGQRVS